MFHTEVENHQNKRDISSKIGKLSSSRKPKKNISFTPLLLSSSGKGRVSFTLMNSYQSIIQIDTDSSSEDSFIVSQEIPLLTKSSKQNRFNVTESKIYNDQSSKSLLLEGETSMNKSLKAIEYFMKKNDEEIRSLTSTQEINDFYTYTEACFEQIKHINYDDVKKSKSKFYIDEYDLSQKKKLAIFDLDETLVHCMGQDYKNAQFSINVNISTMKSIQVGINLRPFWKEALNLIKQYYTIVIFTASHQSYADSVLNLMDPNNEYFKYRLYRHHCSTIMIDKQTRYLKNLEVIQDISLKDMIIIDNSVFSFAFQLDNGIPIIPYYNAQTDTELFFLSYYLNAISSYYDLREANRKNINLNEYNSINFNFQLEKKFKETKNKKPKLHHHLLNLEMKDLMTNKF